jgi:hypothetical protein
LNSWISVTVDVVLLIFWIRLIASFYSFRQKYCADFDILYLETFPEIF